MSSPSSGPPRRRSWILWLLTAFLLIGAGIALFLPAAAGQQTKTLTYSAFLNDVEAHKVATATIGTDGTVTGDLSSGAPYTTVVPVSLAGEQLLGTLHAGKVDVTAEPASQGSIWSSLLTWFLILAPIGLIIWFWSRISKSASRSGGLFGVGRSSAKLFTPSPAQTTFADVAGYEGAKAEVSEIVDFLRNPERYRRLGAKAPRGVLLVGPPGTGKTLLARAVAGEAQVAFFSVDGSSFVEMFVGVGASRVRDLFEKVRSSAPAILFIDEIDAIGQRRSSASSFAANDEREQTLNQLLAEMDGFETSSGVVVLAATNRPDILDPALLRPGRFDRHITVPLPNAAERAAILAVHCQGKPLDSDVDLGQIARATPGFSGADLANLANEAAIEAVRAGRTSIARRDFGAARDRLILGRRESSSVLLAEEKQQVAVHECGHAIVAALCDRADPVDRITILPAGETLGATEQLPVAEHRIQQEGALLDRLTTELGGRAAELIVYGEGSTGAAADLAAATSLATRMVRDFGLSDELGPVGYPTGEDPTASGATLNRPYSEQTQRAVDTEVSRLLREAESRAADLIATHRGALDALVARLIEAETLDGAVVYDIVGRPAPERVPDLAATPPSATAPPGAAAAPEPPHELVGGPDDDGARNQ
ncbi:ATP-dependent zinc metalloprotease FtsH [Leifsonia sp. AG29]|uniref:ATP-dependent zinc metalloprotease FtsH n=1 Tax=Leifsonia sp. AG29 TaxID=2598860 RepID=UPI00131E1747|nr:ATP-dependent zinc metalloprotease FtsH [Leifsonia sp. AG29]